MKNYRLKVTLNSWKTSDPTGKVENVYLNLLEEAHNITEMCKNGAMSSYYNDSSFYGDYQNFFFQAENSVEAYRIGLDHYYKQDLEKIGDKSVTLLFIYADISYEQAKGMSEEEAEAYMKTHMAGGGL